MQIKSLRIKSYRSWPINETSSAEAIKRLKKLELYEQLKTEGCSSATCLIAIDWSKATYYRWRSRYQQQGLTGLEALSCRPQRVREPSWSKQQEQQVQHLKLRFPLWAKRKIWKVLSRDHGFTLSISTVGRILKKLLRLNRIKPVAFYFGRIKPKRRRPFKHHARRWKYGMKAKQPGELIQVDPMSVSFTEGFALKQFKATYPVTGTTIMRTYSSASSRNARRFLDYLIAQLPYALFSVQVDGGSEFRDEFEQACNLLKIPLFVLPPRKPKWNGCVERANGTTRYEFYPFYEGSLTLAAVNKALADYQQYYNHYRPHDGAGLATPISYYQKLIQAD